MCSQNALTRFPRFQSTVQKAGWPNRIITISISLVLATVIMLSADPLVDSSYAGGVVQEYRPFIPSEHSLSLVYNITNVSTNDEPHTLFTLGLFDEERQEFFKFVTYGIEAYELLEAGEKKKIMNLDAFYAAENDTLILDITHREGETQVFGTIDDFNFAWKADPNSDSIRVFMPLETNLTYLMHIEIIGIDSPRGLLNPEQVPSVDIYFNTNEDDSGKVMLVPGELVVVPEFPYHVVLIVSVVIGSIIAISRMGLLVRFYSS